MQQVRGLSADLGAVQPERMQFDVCSVDDDADSAVLFLCDDRDRVALAFCMNGGGRMGIEDNLIDHDQVTRDCCAEQAESHAHITPATYGSLCIWRVAACVFRLSLVYHFLASRLLTLLQVCTHSLVFASD